MPLHYITSHYITLHYITLHYITLHYVTLYNDPKFYLRILRFVKRRHRNATVIITRVVQLLLAL